MFGNLYSYIPSIYPLVLAINTCKSVCNQHDFPDGLERKDIKNKLGPFLERLKIREDIVFLEVLAPGYAEAKGVNFSSFGKVFVLLQQETFTLKKETVFWIARHEIAHIKNNDAFKATCVASICSSVSAFFLSKIFSPFSTTLLTIGITLGVESIFSQYCEGQADDIAIEESDKEELKGAKEFLLKMQKEHLKTRETFPWLVRWIISPTGDLRYDIKHPSLISRLEKIEKAIAQIESKVK